MPRQKEFAGAGADNGNISPKVTFMRITFNSDQRRAPESAGCTRLMSRSLVNYRVAMLLDPLGQF